MPHIWMPPKYSTPNGSVISTQPQTPPELYTGVTNKMASGSSLVASLLISVMNPSTVFDDVAVRMKCEVTVTVAEAGATAHPIWHTVPTVTSTASAAALAPRREAGLRLSPMTTPLSHRLVWS